jgi:hypothetical protein
MKLGNLHFFVRPWFRFGFLRVSSEQWQLKLGCFLIQRMPAR